MGDETKTGGAGPEEVRRTSASEDDTEGQRLRTTATDPEATEGDTEGQTYNKWLAHEPEKEGSAVGGDDTEGQIHRMPTATSDQPGVGPDDARKMPL